MSAKSLLFVVLYLDAAVALLVAVYFEKMAFFDCCDRLERVFAHLAALMFFGIGLVVAIFPLLKAGLL